MIYHGPFSDECAFVLQRHAHNDKEPIQVVGLLFVKELILVDPEDDLPIRNICHHWFGTDIPVVFEDCLASELIKVRCHLWHLLDSSRIVVLSLAESE
jgi:hypothetical protein